MYYDKEDPLDIERYAKQIIGKDFREILRASYVAETDAKLVLNKSKGNLGEIIEEYHFYYKPNSNNAPDFKDANVELKVTPYKRNLNGTFSSKERLVLNIINYLNIIQEKFKSSTLLSKNSTLLLIFYLWEREIYQLDYKIDYAGLYNFPPEDLLIIEQDWNIILKMERLMNFQKAIQHIFLQVRKEVQQKNLLENNRTQLLEQSKELSALKPHI